MLQQVLHARPGGAVDLAHVDLLAGFLQRADLEQFFLYLLFADSEGFRVDAAELAPADVAGKLLIGAFGQMDLKSLVIFLLLRLE